MLPGVQGFVSRVSDSLQVFGTTLANPSLRRLLFAFAAFCMSEWAAWIALMVYAYQRGGATGTAVVSAAQLIPSAIVAPLGSVLGDRYRRDRYLFAGYLLQALLLLAAGTSMVADAREWLVVVLAVPASAAMTLTRPAQSALLPQLVASPDELTAANVASGVIESAGVLIGPAAAGAVMGLFGPGAVIVATGVLQAFAALSARLIAPQPRPAGGISAERLVRGAIGGFQELAQRADTRLVVGLGGVESILVGAFDVFYVVIAIGLLGLEPSAPGYLMATLGVGGLVGGGVALFRVGRGGLASAIGAGLVLLGLPIALVGARPGIVLAFSMFAAAGAGMELGQVAGRTLLQRVVPDGVLARVFGVLEGLYMAGLAVGSVGAAALVAAVGPRWALVTAGAVPTVAATLSWRRLRRIDRRWVAPSLEVELVRSVPMFAPLAEEVVERLARTLLPVEAAQGTVVVRQGEPGDRFYIVRSGVMDVVVDGRSAGEVGPGQGFGEIALLRDVPRTASVVARTDVVLAALAREPFLEAVTGHPAASRFAEDVVDHHLAGRPDRPAS
jgi:MFS family permease